MKARMLIALLLIFVLAGCGGGPKADVQIFLMSANGVPNEVADKLGQSLQTKMGTAATVKVLTTPIFSPEKLMVEIAAAENGILIIPAQQFKALGQQGGYVPLDELAKADDYPEGVLEITENGKTAKHLYGIPMDKTKWFTELNLNGKDLFAFIPANAPNMEKAKLVMKTIAQK